jgi:hypothetical protein
MWSSAAYADELMVMRDGRELVLIENFNPIRGRRLSWLDDDKRRQLGINLRKPAPVISPPISAPAPLPPSPPCPARRRLWSPVRVLHQKRDEARAGHLPQMRAGAQSYAEPVTN